jgi:DNA-binding winged helix-turn-helix (wHTH) protein/WD40 repeat protein
MENSPNGRCQRIFGRFEVDLVSGELYKQGRLVPLQEQPFRVLSALLERPGEMVTREDLRKKLWPDGTFVDFDDGIDTALKKLRQALADSAQNPVFIETIPRRGYRFIAPVSGNGSVSQEFPPQPRNDSAALATKGERQLGEDHSKNTGFAVRRIPLVTKYAAVIGIFLMAVLAVRLYRSYSRTAAPEPKLRQLTFNSIEFPVTSAAISPDGKYLAYSDSSGMHLKLISTSETSDIRSPEVFAGTDLRWEIVNNGWFPDSAVFLANSHPAASDPDRWTSEESSIWAFSVLGGPPRKLRDAAVAYSVSPGGLLISFGTNHGKWGEREIWLMGPAAEGARKLYEADEESSVASLLWSPDGKRVLYILSDQAGDHYLVRDLAGGPPSTLFLTSESKNIKDASWLPDGRLVYSAGATGSPSDTCNLWVVRLDPRTGLPVEKSKQLSNWAGFCVSRISATHGAHQIAFQEWSNHSATYLADLQPNGRALRDPKRFNLEDDEDAIADWTADNSTVIVVRNREDQYFLYRKSLKEGRAVVIASSTPGSLLEAAEITPDSDWVILQVYSIAGGPSAPTPIMRVPLAGGSPEPMFSAPAGSGFMCARPPSMLCLLAQPSPDRKQLIVSAFDPANKKRGTEMMRLYVGPALKDEHWPWCSLSPDGTRLAFSPSPEGPIQIHSLNGRLLQFVRVKGLQSLRLLSWAGDGKGLFMVSGIKDGTAVQHVDLNGNSQILWKCTGGRQCDYGPSPDGRQLAILDRQLSANFWLMENF